jgi:hypothetical protein
MLPGRQSSMSEYAFYEFQGEVPLPQGAELLPAPVRREMEQRVFGGAAVRIGLLPEELTAFLSEYPDLRARYRRTATTLAWLAALDEGMSGDTTSAERHLGLGLKVAPGDVLLRSNYALVLQLQERNEEALEQYETVLADPEGAKNPVVSLLAARIYAQQKRFREAYGLLKPLEGVYFNDDSYRSMLGQMKELVGASDHGATTAAAPPAAATRPAPDACASCGAPVGPDQKFCYKCGKVVQARPAPRPFCGFCGAPVEKSQSFCYKCGKKV